MLWFDPKDVIVKIDHQSNPFYEQADFIFFYA